MTCAPVVLFVYNRPWHVRQTVLALQRNTLAKESDLFIFSDAAAHDGALPGVREVREYIETITGFNSVTIVTREKNLGLSNSIISGVTDILAERERIIVLEDDLVCAPFFLEYMNKALDLYVNEEHVISIHGYNYPVSRSLPETFFLRGADCWGWGTWRRGWRLFERDGSRLLEGLRDQCLTKQFDFNGSYPFTRMLQKQVAGKIDSWAVRWYASAFLNDMLTLYPGKSLVRNIGNDGTGTNVGSVDFFGNSISEFSVGIQKIPIAEDQISRKEIERYFRSIRIKRILGRINHYINYFVPR